jgi:hypothetical protein
MRRDKSKQTPAQRRITHRDKSRRTPVLPRATHPASKIIRQQTRGSSACSKSRYLQRPPRGPLSSIRLPIRRCEMRVAGTLQLLQSCGHSTSRALRAGVRRKVLQSAYRRVEGHDYQTNPGPATGLCRRSRPRCSIWRRRRLQMVNRGWHGRPLSSPQANMSTPSPSKQCLLLELFGPCERNLTRASPSESDLKRSSLL